MLLITKVYSDGGTDDGDVGDLMVVTAMSTSHPHSQHIPNTDAPL